MNAKERVIAAVRLQQVDAIPSGFSYHFPKGNEYGDAGVNIHLEFFRNSGGDIYKIMNDNRIPSMSTVKTPQAWDDVKSLSLKDDCFARQIDMTKRILDELDGSHFTMGTLHGVLSSCRHATSDGYTLHQTREIMCAHYRENKQPVKDAFRRMADSLCLLAEAYVATGIDSVMYASLGAEKHYFTDEEYAELITPLDKQVMSVVQDSKDCISFLHICKENLNMDRFASYTDYAEAFNWGVYETDYSLEKGRALFKGKCVWGGLANRSGVLVDGSLEQIAEEVKGIVAAYGRKGFILGADCTLPTDIDHKRVLAAAEAAHRC
jgi:uroporphyrinogen decarboxylase